ncbi:hypothetical protein PM082_022004 [Marasmius tenuissimus]|nr:hypothetical protein PM082_022004 [Marasmius tenuissimus]
MFVWAQVRRSCEAPEPEEIIEIQWVEFPFGDAHILWALSDQKPCEELIESGTKANGVSKRQIKRL